MEANVTEALRLLKTYGGGHARVWNLAGSSRRSCRKHVLEVLLGRKVKSTECGIGQLRQAIYAATGVTGECEAARDSHLMQLAEQVA